MNTCRQAVIVAAGRGSRLAPLTDERPKCLVELGGAALIDSLIDRLGGIGVRHIIVVAGYRAEQVRAHVDVRRRVELEVEVVDSPRWETTQNALSLHLVAELVRPPFVLLDGDLWLSAALAGQLARPDRIAVAPLRPGMIGTRAALDGGAVVGLGPDRGYKTVNAASFSSTWWHRWFRPSLDRMIDAGGTGEFYEVAMGLALRAGAPPLEAVMAGDGDWFEIDSAADLAAANKHFASARAA